MSTPCSKPFKGLWRHIWVYLSHLRVLLMPEPAHSPRLTSSTSLTYTLAVRNVFFWFFLSSHKDFSFFSILCPACSHGPPHILILTRCHTDKLVWLTLWLHQVSAGISVPPRSLPPYPQVNTCPCYSSAVTSIICKLCKSRNVLFVFTTCFSGSITRPGTYQALN